MKSILNYTALVVLVIASFSSCTKKDPVQPATPTTDTGLVYLEFFNVAGGSNLILNDEWYKNENGDSFTVSKFNYYISNIVLNGADGVANYTESDSYHLIEHSATPSQMAFSMPGVAGGKYTSVTFTIGVDSLHNVSGAQTGALDPVLGNFWSWNTGYIMLKFEGNSPKSTAADGKLLFHCGGFSGEYNVLKTVTINFPNEIAVSKTGTPHIHLQADILKLFKSPNVIDFSTTTTIHMPGAAAKKISDNYENLFTVTYAGL
jgi:hypothetical protein